MLTGLTPKKLRNWLLIFFFALLLPATLLIQQSYSRLKWETFHQYQLMADELSQRIDKQFLQLVNTEQQRPFTDYSFLNVAGDASAKFFQRSPLSQYPVESLIPGVVGYFQVDSTGGLMTPLLPVSGSASRYGITDSELTSRIALQDQIQLILSQNRLLQKPPLTTRDSNTGMDAVAISAQVELLDTLVMAEEEVEAEDEVVEVNGLFSSKEMATVSSMQSQQAFDDLKAVSPAKKRIQKTKLGRLEDLSLNRRYQQQQAEQDQLLERKRLKQESLKRKKVSSSRRLRTETNALPEMATRQQSAPAITSGKTDQFVEAILQPAIKPLRISTFESEIDPLEFSRLDKGYFILFRKVWRNDQRFIQGLLIAQEVYLDQIINKAFRATVLSQMSDLLVSHQGNVLEAFSARGTDGYLSSTRELQNDLLYQIRLSDPLSDLQLIFSITQLPIGPGGQVIIWLTLILLFVLCAGFYFLYRLGIGQINLFNQQQDFVSSVSHELKTPLTSIRLYAEMLREGWAAEDRKKTYYNFIFDESERLSRLIQNVLLMARLTRNKQQVEFKTFTVKALMDAVEPKIFTQIAAAGFKVNQYGENVEPLVINVDADWFSQIMINLVDNAIKFSAKADRKEIRIGCVQLSNGYVQFTIRDYGPGISEQQMKKIFTLFYRTEDELTRETVGTGIGLALVHQMMLNMNAVVDVINCDPGAEFSLKFPLVKQ